MKVGQGALPPAVGLSGFELDMYRVQRSLHPAPGPPEEPPSSFSLRDLLTPLFRHKFTILAVFILSSLASAFYVANAPDAFVSNAGVQLDERRRDLVLDPTGSESNGFLAASRGSSDSARSEISLLRSTSIAEQVVDQIGVDEILSHSSTPPSGEVAFDYDQLNWFGKSLYFLGGIKAKVVDALNLTPPELNRREKAILMVQESLNVSQVPPGSPYLTLEYAASEPQRAQKILSTLLDVYVKNHIEMNSVASPAIFQKQLNDLRKNYADKEDKLEEEKKRLNIISLEAQKEQLIARLTQLETQMNETTRLIQAATIREKALSQELDKPTRQEDLTAAGNRDPALDLLRSKIVELKLQQVDLGKRYKSSSKPMQTLQAQIGEYEAMLKKQATSEALKFTDPLRRSRELELAMQKVEVDVNTTMKEALAKDIEKTQTELAFLTGNESHIKRLEQELQLEYNDMEQTRRSYNVAKHAEMFDKDRISNVSIKQAATLPVLSSKNPRKLMALLGIGIFGGLFFGIILAYALEFINHTIRTNEDVEKWLGLPVLTALPYSRNHLPVMREEIL